MDQSELQLIVELIAEQIAGRLRQIEKEIPVGISNRHVHLSAQDKEVLFGENYELTLLKNLKQPGQYACRETVTIKGPKGEITGVRVLGPERRQTQVEISQSDCIKLGVEAPLRESGDLRGSSPIEIFGPKGALEIKEGAIVAQRHIHMSAEDARAYGVQNGQIASVKVNTPKGGILSNVLIRSGEGYELELHIDTDEANAMGVQNNQKVELIR